MSDTPLLLNPDSAMLQQSEGNWQKYVALILFKLSPKESVFISLRDMQRFEKFHAQNIMVMGHPDGIEFKLVDDASATRLAEHDMKSGGSS